MPILTDVSNMLAVALQQLHLCSDILGSTDDGEVKFPVSLATRTEKPLLSSARLPA